MFRSNSPRKLLVALAILPLMSQTAFPWGTEGHRMINRLAGQTLPSDVPAFLRSPAALDALAYYGPEPDRWKGATEPESNAAGSPEHYIDLEWADLAGPLPRRRYDYVRALAEAQKSHPELPLTPEKVGLQPYVTLEYWERLKSSMREYRGLFAAHQDTKPVEAEIVFLAGIMGHFVADASNPLHVTIQYNGWTGPNPAGYDTGHMIHGRFESDFVRANVVAQQDVAPLIPATPTVLKEPFTDYMAYLRHSNSLVEPLYRLDKAHGFEGAGTAQGKEMVDERLAAGATELRDMIYTAWLRSADPLPVREPRPQPKPDGN